MGTPLFYALIIGSEILAGRRRDAHFAFVRDLLEESGYTLHASLVIKDNPELIARTFRFINADPDAVMFCFGGIGATPDDYTRAVAAEVFTGKPPVRHPEALKLIEAQFGEAARPHRVMMADLPEGATLLPNPVNNVPGFSLEERLFFVPGFPNMAHPMITAAFKRLFRRAVPTVRKTLTVMTGENDLIELMHALPKTVELSSLPSMAAGRRRTVLSLVGSPLETHNAFASLQEGLRTKNLSFIIGDYPTEETDEGYPVCCNPFRP